MEQLAIAAGPLKSGRNNLAGVAHSPLPSVTIATATAMFAVAILSLLPVAMFGV